MGVNGFFISCANRLAISPQAAYFSFFNTSVISSKTIKKLLFGKLSFFPLINIT